MAYAPIQNPVYLDATPWPYIKGPNYTRPVFAEHTARGNFVATPIIRMPSLNGLGEDPQSALPATPPAPLTATVMCDPYKAADAETYAKCIKWNQGVIDVVNASDAAGLTKKNDAQDAAGAKCKGIADTNAWAKCYFGALDAKPWYANPWYLGGAMIGAAVVLGLITQSYRRSEE